MYNDHEKFLLYSGQHYSVFFHAETNQFSSVHDYFEGCDYQTQSSLLFFAKVISNTGRLYDDTKFRIEDKKNKIYCFKPRGERFFCFFFTGKKIIITSAHPKKKQKLDRRELEKAINIKKQYP